MSSPGLGAILSFASVRTCSYVNGSKAIYKVLSKLKFKKNVFKATFVSKTCRYLVISSAGKMANFMIVETLSYGLITELINLQLLETTSGHKIEAYLSFCDKLP